MFYWRVGKGWIETEVEMREKGGGGERGGGEGAVRERGRGRERGMGVGMERERGKLQERRLGGKERGIGQRGPGGGGGWS